MDPGTQPPRGIAIYIYIDLFQWGMFSSSLSFFFSLSFPFLSFFFFLFLSLFSFLFSFPLIYFLCPFSFSRRAAHVNRKNPDRWEGDVAPRHPSPFSDAPAWTYFVVGLSYNVYIHVGIFTS